MKQVVKTNGLELPREYKILVIAGGSPANLARLASGQIAATTIAVPLTLSRRKPASTQLDVLRKRLLLLGMWHDAVMLSFARTGKLSLNYSFRPNL